MREENRPKDTMSDGELVRQALEGRTTACEELARRWSPRLLAVCQARVGRDAAEDLAQDSLLRALQSLRQLDQPERFGPWSRAIAIRACIDWQRRRRIMERPETSLSLRLDGTAAQAATATGASLEVREEREQLWSAVETLGDDLKEVLLLFYCDNLSYDAVAELLDVSRATVNSRLAKARDQLRRRLDPDRERDRGLCQRS
jgi:RNA polymerase sigma-70 factor (ECF subfamily)